MYCRRTKQLAFFPLLTRSKAEILDQIRLYIPRGSAIITDALSSYNDLSKLGYRHDVINKKVEGFSRFDEDENLRVNVNGIESAWHTMRTVYRQRRGIKKKHMLALAYEVQSNSRGMSILSLLKQ